MKSTWHMSQKEYANKDKSHTSEVSDVDKLVHSLMLQKKEKRKFVLTSEDEGNKTEGVDDKSDNELEIQAGKKERPVFEKIQIQNGGFIHVTRAQTVKNAELRFPNYFTLINKYQPLVGKKLNRDLEDTQELDVKVEKPYPISPKLKPEA